MQVIHLADIVIPPQVLGYVTEPMAQLYRIIPVSFRDGTLTIAVCDPQNITVQDELRTFLGYEIRAVVATERDIADGLERYYSTSSESVESLVADMEADKELAAWAEKINKEGPIELDNFEAAADSAPVRKLLNMVLLLAIKDQACDLHFEPFEDEFRIRIKADGVLYEMVPPPRHLAFAITTRIKVMAKLDIAERRVPQDGRIELTIGGHPVDLRVSVLPTMFGESVVMRVLDRSVVSLDLNKVGMDQPTLSLLPHRHAQTERDHPGHRSDGVGQDDHALLGPERDERHQGKADHHRRPGRVRHRRHHPGRDRRLDRQHLRQLPAVDLAARPRPDSGRRDSRHRDGRDRGAGLADRAHRLQHAAHQRRPQHDHPLAQHGHSGVLDHRHGRGHPGPAAGPPHLLQLPRGHGPQHRNTGRSGTDQADIVGKTFYRGRGCDVCNNTGYKGRVGLFELMIMNDDLRDMVMRNASRDELRDAARGFGMVTLRDAGMNAVYRGLTTADEVIRETILEA